MTDFNDTEEHSVKAVRAVKATQATQADVDRILPIIREHMFVEFADDFGFIAGPHSVDGTYAIGARNPDDTNEWLILWEVPADHPSLAHARMLAMLANLMTFVPEDDDEDWADWGDDEDYDDDED